MSIKSLPTLFIQAALVATATVLALVLVTRYVYPIPFSVTQTTTQKDTSFNVSGKSTVTTQPDKVEVTLGIMLKENDLKQAQTHANQVINDITQKLVNLGVSKDNIKTQDYSINPNYDYSKPIQSIQGYSVNTNIVVSLTDFSKLNQVIDTATAAGANQVNGVVFTLSDQKEKEVIKEARSKAIQDAQNNANELARLSGMKLGRIINVSEGNTIPRPIPMMAKSFGTGMAADAAVGAPTNIQPGSTDYTYSVTLSYETL